CASAGRTPPRAANREETSVAAPRGGPRSRWLRGACPSLSGSRLHSTSTALMADGAFHAHGLAPQLVTVCWQNYTPQRGPVVVVTRPSGLAGEKWVIRPPALAPRDSGR